MDIEAIIKYLEELKEEELNTQNKYRLILFDIVNFIRKKEACYSKEVTDILERVSQIPYEEFKHHFLLSELICLLRSMK